jgi:hypothetical protein
MHSFRRALAPAALAAAALAFACALHSSLACPVVQPPQPLRKLYMESARVVVARVGASEVVESRGDAVHVRVTLHVTENVKGEGERVARLYFWRDKNESPEAPQLVTFSARAAPPLKQGERFLFFLDTHEDRGDGYQVNDSGYGIKQLSDEALKVYLERMKELADITRGESEDKAALVEWLVRCAEEPATRWEGAYELLESAGAAGGEDESGEASEVSNEESAEGKDTEGKDAEGDAVVETPRMRPPNFRHTRPDASFVALLNPVQKQRLANALFGSEELGEGESTLLHVVREFEDPRFVPFVRAHLRRVEDAPPQEAAGWLSALAAALKNEKIVELADAYLINAPYYDDEEEESEEQSGQESESESEDDEAPEAEEEAAPEAPEDPEAEAAREAAAYERATRKRAAMLKDALTRIDYFISTGQLASN